MTYSVKQVAERFAVGEHTVLKWIASGELVAVNVGRKIGGKPRWRITADAITAFEMLRAPTPRVTAIRRRRRTPADVISFY